MVRPKSSGSKKPKRTGGVDFKKIKRKIGRKLPPPKNATNTQIKSKAIVLPEQSVASERTGLAVNSRGLTLRELLQQTSHHSAKTRKFSLSGIRDLLLKHPSELKMHKYVIIEKLRERICDSDRAVREAFYHLLKTIIFPGIKEEITGPIISLMMAYLFNAMTHLSLDIRLMAFKFFHLIMSNHPPSFPLYAEKVLDCYGDIMRNTQLYLEDKTKLKDILDGLLQFLSSFTFSNDKSEPQHGHGNAACRPLHAFGCELPRHHTGLSSITKKLEELLPLLINFFQELFSVVHTFPSIDTVSFNCILCILQIINLVVGFSVSEKDQIHRYRGVSVPSLFGSHNSCNIGICDHLKKLWAFFPVRSIHETLKKDDNKYYIMNIRIAEIFFRLHEQLDDSMDMKEKFLVFIEGALSEQNYGNTHSIMMVHEKYFVSVIQLIPSLVSQVSGHWRDRLLRAFTSAFLSCRDDSKVMVACLHALVELLLNRGNQNMLLDFSSQELLQYQTSWLCKLPYLLRTLSDKHPSLSKVILELQLRIGQSSVSHSSLATGYENLQLAMKEFYVTVDELGVRHYGAFVQLPADCQEIAICCLYYFSRLDPSLLEALVFCCLCNQLEPTILLRILEVLNSMCKCGRIKLEDHISFLITIVARFGVLPEIVHPDKEMIRNISKRETFRVVTEAVFSCLLEIGDQSLVLKLLQKTTLEAMSLKPHIDNMQAMLSLIVRLDSRTSRFLQSASGTLGQYISSYLIDASYFLPENMDLTVHKEEINMYQFYVKPCICLFFRSGELLSQVLNRFSSYSSVKSDSEQNEVFGVASSVLFMLRNTKLHQYILSNGEALKCILQYIYMLLCDRGSDMTSETKHKLQFVYEQLKTEASNM